MDTLMDNPAFRTYAVCASILAIKMIYSAVYTSTMRFKTKGFVNEEDARAAGDPSVKASATETPEVAHALRIQRNDGENILPFFAIGLIYVLSGATTGGATAYLWTFTIARIVHTIVYTMQLQPWRAISFGVGVLCMVGMSVQIIWAAL